MIHDRLCAKNKRVFVKIHVFWLRIYFQIHQINKYTYLYHKTMQKSGVASRSTFAIALAQKTSCSEVRCCRRLAALVVTEVGLTYCCWLAAPSHIWCSHSNSSMSVPLPTLSRTLTLGRITARSLCSTPLSR